MGHTRLKLRLLRLLRSDSVLVVLLFFILMMIPNLKLHSLRMFTGCFLCFSQNTARYAHVCCSRRGTVTHE